MSKLVQINMVDNGKTFIFNGTKYKLVSQSKYWRSFVRDDGTPVEPKDIPTEFLIGKIKVEVLDD
jgi:hypothetical protein